MALRLAAFVALAAIALTCSPKRPQVQVANVALGWTFTPEDGEQRVIESLVLSLGSEAGGNGSFYGEVWRFGTSSVNQRFLLVRAEPENGRAFIVFYVLELRDSRGRVSVPFRTGVRDLPWRFETLDVADIDGDGLPDFPYCEWDGVADSMRIAAVGYKTAWYRVTVPDSLGRLCPVP